MSIKEQSYPQLIDQLETALKETHANMLVVKAEVDKITAENKRLREALESIAARTRPRHGDLDYWMSFSHEAVANTVTEDTWIARNALDAGQVDSGKESKQ